jgi:HEAT repeat protein
MMPGESDDFSKPLSKGVAPIPTIEIGAGLASVLGTPTPSAGKIAQRASDIDVDQAKLSDILESLNDYDPKRRGETEAQLFTQFDSFIRKCATAEKQGQTGDVLRKVEGVFQLLEQLGQPYRFENTDAKKQFLTRLAVGWAKLPYVSRWAYIRMLGIVGGVESREVLSNAMTEGVFEDEAAISLLRTGDDGSIPVLIDYIARGRIKANRFNEIKAVVANVGSGRMVEILISFLDNPDENVRAAALGLLQALAVGSEQAPKESNAGDPALKQKWASWWVMERESYKPPIVEPEREIVALTLITGFDSLPADGRFNKAYFMKRASVIERTCKRLKALDRRIHDEGERMLYNLTRLMAEDYHAADKVAADIMVQYIDAFTKEVQKICLRQSFPATAARDDFHQWATANIEKAQMPILTFVLRILGISGGKDILSFMQKYSQSWVPDVRRAAVMSLGLLGDPLVLDEIKKMLANNDVSLEDGTWGVVAMERIGNAKAREALIEVLRSGKPLIAYDAYLALKRMRKQPGKPLSLEEFEQGRSVLVEEFAAWNKAKRS